MHRITNIIKNTALCFLAAMLSVSCLAEKDGPSPERQNVMIQMSVSTGTGTKAQPREVEETINTLRVYAFYGDKLAGYATRQATALNDPFYMDLELPESGTHDVEFYLIANEAEMADQQGTVQLTSTMTKAQLEAIRFTGLVHRTILPMYCKQTVALNVDRHMDTANTANGHLGHFILEQKITFVLSRSLAKLSVYAAKVEGASVVPQVLSVNLLANGTRQYSYLFPQTDAVLNAVASRSNDRVLLSAPVAVQDEVAKGSAQALDPANYTEIFTDIYLPEVTYGSDAWNLSSGNDREAVLHIRYSLGDQQDIRNGYVYLPRVDRNLHIKVCLLINPEGQLIANYDVAEWDWDEDMMADWFFDYPTHTYVWHTPPETEADFFTKPNRQATMSEAQPFEGYFQMTYPTSDKWTPTLEGLHSSDANISVYNIRTGEKVFSSSNPVQLPVSEDWFRIEVLPKTGHMVAGEFVNLAITYTPGGLLESEYLLINGSYPDFFWDGSTSENYVTITMVN